jgi:hypothetical protein
MTIKGNREWKNEFTRFAVLFPGALGHGPKGPQAAAIFPVRKATACM